MTARKAANLLLVDDDPSLLKLLGMRLTSEGFHVTTAESGQEALRLLAREQIDLVISDLRMDEMDGMALFAEIQKRQPGMPVIILTAHGSIPDAVAATQQGVFSFLTKPVDRDALYKAIDEALSLSAPAGDDSWREDIVTRSPAMLRLLEQANMVAQSDVSVLINGQSGTGKEVLAQAIHRASPRAKKAFIAINCGALPEQLLESELFGHAKGAFTGAVSSREGCSRRRRAARCFSMRSVICRCRCRLSCCACCRSARCGRWAATAIWILTCASSRRPTAICRRRWRKTNSVRICTIA
ncbi:Quorum-sensing regulator protein F [Serratia rubidaea]|uniref:Quorum-sensing regulator protein F n=1 Tax=Serratia rubidaea TaxID=61652 RepID=A0A3S4FQK9_SERRU|nr:Quorum-sensing regulator protein F [Serratia rubidaea]